ncbi:MAG: asparagine synthase (glutamine-hydrolyzing) [Chloroflexi bacterium]|nr:MAG: asparagine synthase (glutamine-hydrolyzing) [Chloroflexota bacterium]
MCGICGFWGPPERGVLEGMAACIRHRGPDDDGFLETPDASLGMRRLAIIDIELGRQPIANEDARVVTVYNGEIYNYRELRQELKSAGHEFRTNSDTEVIVHGYEEWGPECFSRFNGMWAAAIIDRRNGAPKLVLARDHFGIKPLYWARAGGRLLFASEIKAFFQEPAFSCDPDPQRIHDYLTLGFHDRRDESFFKGVHQLPAAHYAVVDAGGMTQERYWQPVLASDGSADPQEFRRLFEKAVERRLVAEVPVGTCLSGGLDSSAIVCFMSELLEKHVPDAASMGDHLKTFSAVFDGDPIDERDYIDLVLKATGAEKNFVHPTAERFLEELDRVVWHQEEPMVSTGPYAQWCVMRKAQGEVTVLLDGQGGDELLAGYVPYQFVYLRQLLRERRFGRLLAEAWAARDVLWPLLRRRLGERGKRFPTARLIRDGFRASVQPARDPRVRDDLKRRLLQDLTEFSLPSLLRYEDRNSMAFSMESRPPYLDQELVEWILRLPETAIVDAGWSRAILREGLRGVLPEKIRTRRWKVGFTTPEFRWLRAERAWVQGLLRSPAFCARPYWDGLALADAFDRVCDDRLEEHPFVWRALNTEAWLRVFFSPEGGARTGRLPEAGLARIGDELAPSLLGTASASAALERFQPNPGRHLFATARGGAVFARAPLKSRKVAPGDDLEAAVREALGSAGLEPGDVLALSEKAVAVSQGRSLPIEEVHPGRAAKLLSRYVRRSPVGIGIAMPETMQLAIEEVGLGRILLAAGAAVVTKPLGMRGVFYRVAGPRVAAIDGPTPYTIPPSNTHAKRAPADPDGVARRLAAAFGCGVAIIDANDIGCAVLGASQGADRELVVSLFRDNPLGQKDEQTPFALLRRVGELRGV